VIDTREFPLTELDDIATSYNKTFWLVAHMVAENIRNGRIRTGAFTEQKESPSYLPKRTPEDGEIDWSRSARQVYDFVRALTRPYPAAFSRLGGQVVKIWRVRPFDVPVFGSYAPGTIIKVFSGGEWLVQAGDIPVLVYDLEYGGAPVESGARFAECSFRDQMKRIIERHEQAYPDHPVAEDLYRVAGLVRPSS
jgi:methionyl-tRNA formyltransferase